jgi:hypothetical protein
MYSLLSEHTHPNQGAMALSQTDHPEGRAAWTLQPEFSKSILNAAVRPGWLAMELGLRALAEVMRVAEDHPMELPTAIRRSHQANAALSQRGAQPGMQFEFVGLYPVAPPPPPKRP